MTGRCPKTETRSLDRELGERFGAYLSGIGVSLPGGLTVSPSIWWMDDAVMIVDQRRLPVEETVLVCRRPAAVTEAIRTLAVRGAPAIGLAAAYGLALGMRSAGAGPSSASPADRFHRLRRMMVETRPTAVNLPVAVNRLAGRLVRETGENLCGGDPFVVLLDEAGALHREIVKQDMEMAGHGMGLITGGERILTHCHTGGLATGGMGTALGVIKAAHAAGKPVSVLCCETRPLLQGARLTAWELGREGVPYHLITDSMAAHFMGRGEVDRVLVGADRVAVNGDTANKIGTRSLALLARANGIPFHVVAPTSTLDPDLPTGEGIPIEERDGNEVRQFAGAASCLPDTPVRNPAFDVTPGSLITSVVTERGVHHPPLEAPAASVRDGSESRTGSWGGSGGGEPGK